MSTTPTIEECLVKATEQEYHWPVLQKLHEEALERLRTLGLPSRPFSLLTAIYYDRVEQALDPPLRWQIGRSQLEVLILVITEEAKREEWRELGDPGLREVTPIARIVATAFAELLGVNRHIPIPWSYVEVPGGGRFLRICIADREIEHEETHVIQHIVSYLRFYQNSFPRPHGTGEAVSI